MKGESNKQVIPFILRKVCILGWKSGVSHLAIGAKGANASRRWEKEKRKRKRKADEQKEKRVCCVFGGWGGWGKKLLRR